MSSVLSLILSAFLSSSFFLLIWSRVCFCSWHSLHNDELCDQLRYRIINLLLLIWSLIWSTLVFSASKLKVKFVLQCSSSVFAVKYTMLCQMWTLQWYLFVLNILDMFFFFFLLPFILHNMTQKGQKQNIFLWWCLFHLWVIKLHRIVRPSYACRSSGRWFVSRSAVFLLVHQNRSCLLHYLQVKIAAVGIIHIIVCNGRWLIA